MLPMTALPVAFPANISGQGLTAHQSAGLDADSLIIPFRQKVFTDLPPFANAILFQTLDYALYLVSVM